MAADRTQISHSVSNPLVWFLLTFGMLVLLAIAVGTWWAVGRIDGWAEAQERHSIIAGLGQTKGRIAAEQGSSAAWNDALERLKAGDQDWIAANLVDWVSATYGHDRVYLIAGDGHVVRAAQDGSYLGQALDRLDATAVDLSIYELRTLIGQIPVTGDDATASIGALGVLDTVRLTDGTLAYLSVRPVVPTPDGVKRAPGGEFLLVSVKLISSELLGSLAHRFGFDDLHVAATEEAGTTLPILNNAGRVLGFIAWTPHHPALTLFRDTAPGSLSILGFAAASLFALVAWLRRTAIQLEISQGRTTYFASHDALTGVANRALFEVRLREAMAYEYLAKTKVALVSIDLDGFKEVNDTLGHAAGDELIRQVAKRLTFGLPEEATIARVGGDEFALVQPGMVSEGQARWICEGLVRAFHEPFVLGTETVEMTASLGVCLEEGTAVPATEMLRRADVALYEAKAKGRNRLQFYHPSMDESRRERRTLEIDLRNALLTGEGLFVLYQPIFTAGTGLIAGAEALVRWAHPARGHLAPDVFIGIAEETGLINHLGAWVLEQACRVAVEIGLPWVAVNISPLQMREPEFGARILRTIRQAGLPAHRLELEITEGVLLQNSAIIQSTLEQVQAAGVRIALDDFGTGYSSISYLRTYKVDKLKIDQSFTRQMAHDRVTVSIVQSVIQMAEALGMSVTAEGVEQEAERQLLTDLGCTQLQGYLLSRPVTEARLSEILSRQRAAA